MQARRMIPWMVLLIAMLPLAAMAQDDAPAQQDEAMTQSDQPMMQKEMMPAEDDSPMTDPCKAMMARHEQMT